MGDRLVDRLERKDVEGELGDTVKRCKDEVALGEGVWRQSCQIQ